MDVINSFRTDNSGFLIDFILQDYRVQYLYPDSLSYIERSKRSEYFEIKYNLDAKLDTLFGARNYYSYYSDNFQPAWISTESNIKLYELEFVLSRIIKAEEFLHKNGDVGKILKSIFYDVNLTNEITNILNKYDLHSSDPSKEDLKVLYARMNNSREYLNIDFPIALILLLCSFVSALLMLAIYQMIISSNIYMFLISMFFSSAIFGIYSLLLSLSEIFGSVDFFTDLNLNSKQINALKFGIVPFFILSILLILNFTVYRKKMIVKKPKTSTVFSSVLLSLSFIVIPLCLFFIYDNVYDKNRTLFDSLALFEKILLVFIVVLLGLALIFTVLYQTIKKFHFIYNYPQET